MGNPSDTSVRSYSFYRRNSPVLTASFAGCHLVFVDDVDGKPNFVSSAIVVSNDDTVNEIQFSFDGITVEGDLVPNEVLNMNWKRAKGIYLRCAAGAVPYRVWAW